MAQHWAGANWTNGPAAVTVTIPEGRRGSGHLKRLGVEEELHVVDLRSRGLLSTHLLYLIGL